jgi:GTP-binding protein LepA
VVDASQGVEAQTLANAHLAVDAGLEIIPVLNKIDLPGAEPEKAREQIENVIGIDASGAILASAKQGTGIDEILEAIVTRLPPPKGDPDGPLRALVFDSWFDQYRGVVILVYVVDGNLAPGMKVKLMASGGIYAVEQLGVFTPKPLLVEGLAAGEVGFVIAGIKKVSDTKIGDTLTDERRPAPEPLPGFKEVKPMVFAGLYPVDADQYADLREALDKLRLNDSSFFYEPETSTALGFGFRCGFLGLLHMEIVQERLERESGVDVVQTAPNVTYEILQPDGNLLRIDSPSQVPDPTRIEEFREPMVKLSLLSPDTYVGALMKLAIDRRGRFVKQEYIGPGRVLLGFRIPLAEIIFDFFDKLKSISRGYATMDYEFDGFQADDLVRMRILVNGDEVDALSMICHQTTCETRGRSILKKLRKEIPRHLFQVALQAAVGGKIMARETISPVRKDVTAKCYGGDISRKRKLLEKQKAGKKRLKIIGNVEIPQKAFLAVLSTDEND